MSGIPFNAMWTAPPPPSYTDTIGVDPTDYVVLTTSHGDEALVHKDCLLESPVLRFCFRKRVPLNTEEVIVEFIAAPADVAETAGSAASSFVNTHSSLNAAKDAQQMADAQKLEGDEEGDAEEQNAAGDGPAVTLVGEVDDPPKEEEQAVRYPVTLTETLCTDNTVRIVFPRLNRAQLEVVVAYLYYKHRCNRKPIEPRPQLNIPASVALGVMRVAKTLNC